MPDWSDVLETSKDAVVLQILCLVLLGLVTWEVVVRLPFDCNIILSKRKTRWPSVFYFYCRYSIWLALVLATIVTNATTKLNCQALYTISQFLINTSIGSASTLLMLRTIAVWNHAPLVIPSLIVASLGQWGLLLHGITTVRSSWSDAVQACAINAAPPEFIKLNYLYTMSFDFIVLVLTTYALVKAPSRSSLWQLLFRQGIIYFLVVFIANVIPAIFLILDLNTIMNMMFCVPAAVASSVVACRSFVSLANFLHSDAHTYSTRIRRNTGVARVCASGGDSASDSSVVKIAGSAGNIPVAIPFTSLNSARQRYDREELDVTSAPDTVDSKCGYDFGGAGESVGMTVHHDDGKREKQVRADR